MILWGYNFFLIDTYMDICNKWQLHLVSAMQKGDKNWREK